MEMAMKVRRGRGGELTELAIELGADIDCLCCISWLHLEEDLSISDDIMIWRVHHGRRC